MTEHDIKMAFLPFLREFYRFRYAYQAHTEQVSLDNVTHDGFVADGMLRFTKPEGDEFVCTYEATSLDKIDEVKYTINQPYFLWDCVAFAAFCAAVVYCFLYITDLVFIGKMPLTGKIGLPLGMAIIAFFVWYFFMAGWKKYRYIHAIEQFRRYYADEQWVAISEAVFPAPTNPFFLELKDQCIYQGVGLAIVYPDHQVRLIAAPSRLGVYGGNRRMAHWITDTQLYQSMASNAKAAAAYQPPVPGIFGKLRNTLTRPLKRYLLDPIMRALGKTMQPAYQRFTEAYLVQKWITLLSVLLLVYIGYSATDEKPIVEADRPSRIYVEDEPKPKPSPEKQNGYVLNDRETPIPFGKVQYDATYEDRAGIPRQDEIPADYRDQPAFPSDSKISDAPVTEAPKTSNSSKPQTAVSTTPVQEKKPVEKTSPPTAVAPKSLCERIKSAGGWYIQDNVFSDAANARSRADALRAKKIAADAVNLSCMGENVWAVRLGYNQYTEAAAKNKAAEYSKLIAAAGLKTGKVLVKKVE